MKKYNYKIVEVQNKTKLIRNVLNIWCPNGFNLTSTITEGGFVKLILVKETD